MASPLDQQLDYLERLGLPISNAEYNASLATLTQLEPVAEEEEPDGTEIEENDETQLEAPPPPPNDDDDELRFEEADDDDNSEAAPDAETQLDAEPQPEALPPPVAPEHASPSCVAMVAEGQWHLDWQPLAPGLVTELRTHSCVSRRLLRKNTGRVDPKSA